MVGSPMVGRVVWVDGDDQFDLTSLQIISVEGVAKVGEAPTVTVTLYARLVDIEVPEVPA